MKIHNKDAKSQCPVRHCDRLFHRYDKLRVHLETKHNDNEEVVCPRCKVEVPFIFLREHVRNHERVRNDTNVSVTACYRMRSSIRSCPIASCKHHTRMIQANELQAHLHKHHLEERTSNSESILAAGYHPEDLNLICPVCESQLRTHMDFQLHVETEHIFTDRNRILRIAKKYGLRINDLVFTEKLSVFTDRRVRIEVFEHIAFLRPYSDYAPHRFAIFRLWPGFALHPLFKKELGGRASFSWDAQWPYSI